MVHIKVIKRSYRGHTEVKFIQYRIDLYMTLVWPLYIKLLGSASMIFSVLIIYYNILLRRFTLTGAFLRHYNRIITHNPPWRSNARQNTKRLIDAILQQIKLFQNFQNFKNAVS